MRQQAGHVEVDRWHCQLV